MLMMNDEDCDEDDDDCKDDDDVCAGKTAQRQRWKLTRVSIRPGAYFYSSLFISRTFFILFTKRETMYTKTHFQFPFSKGDFLHCYL